MNGNGGRLRSETQALLGRARNERAPEGSRRAMWEGLERSLSLAPASVGAGNPPPAAQAPTASTATAVSAASTKAATVSAMTTAKASFLGALVGSVVAVSVTAAVFLRPAAPAPGAPLDTADDRPTLSTSADESVPTPFPAAQFAGQAPNAATHADPTQGVSPAASPGAPPSAGPAAGLAATRTSSTSSEGLLREASRVAEARSALLHGDPTAALESIRAARREGHGLEPEELSLETRALRALGRSDEARRVEAQLRTRYPTHALAR